MKMVRFHYSLIVIKNGINYLDDEWSEMKTKYMLLGGRLRKNLDVK
jgi:hypothetical protein